MQRNRHITKATQRLFFATIGVLLSASFAHAETMALRLGTGGSAGTYFPIGTLISRSITAANLLQNNAFRGHKNVVAIAQRSNGSVANVNDLEAGLLEGALSQADVTYWAYYGSGPFADSPPKTSLRTVASLYPESLHLVVRSDSGINNVRDLIGRRVSIDETGSGTLYDVRPLLSAFDINIEDINAVYLKPEDSIDRFRNNKLDAFFIVAGYPILPVVALVREGKANIVSIEGAGIDDLVNDYPFFSIDAIPAGTYQNKQEVKTLAVTAQLIVHANLSDEMVYQLTHRLWSEETAQLLKNGHPKGGAINIEHALNGISIPLHPGARRYYDELSMDLTHVPDSK